MTTENNSSQLPESPASWNCRFYTVDGFSCMLTLRAESGKELLERSSIALDYLREQGCLPYNGYLKDNGNNQSQDNVAWCPIHEVEMRKYSKNGKSWYSHKMEDGTWCSGKPKNGKKE